MNEADKILAQFADVTPEIQAMLDDTLIDMSVDIPEPEHLISQNGRPVCTRGNFSVIIGLPGSRKSFLCTAIAGAFLKGAYLGLDGKGDDSFLLWIDTEQAKGHVQRIGKRLNKICKVSSNSNMSCLKIHCLRDYDPDKRRDFLLAALELYKPVFVVLDGLSDLIIDANSVEQSTSIVNDIMTLTSKYQCHMLTVIHANIGSEKARGHLGSEALRKCETAMFVKANGEITKCSFQKSRDIRPDDFSYMVSNNLPILTEHVEVKTDKTWEDLKKVMPEYPNTISHTEIKKKLKALIMSDGTANNRIKVGVDKGYIQKNGSGSYHLPPPNEEIQFEMFQ